MRLRLKLGSVSAHRLWQMTIQDLRNCGLTRQKAAYCRELARWVVCGRLKLRSLETAEDEEVRAMLMQVKGIGQWSASIYLLSALRRADIWPDGDVALAESTRQIKHLNHRPGPFRLRQIADQWSPWRSVAARILWHAYLSQKKEMSLGDSTLK